MIGAADTVPLEGMLSCGAMHTCQQEAGMEHPPLGRGRPIGWERGSSGRPVGRREQAPTPQAGRAHLVEVEGAVTGHLTDVPGSALQVGKAWGLRWRWKGSPQSSSTQTLCGSALRTEQFPGPHFPDPLPGPRRKAGSPSPCSELGDRV